MLYRAFRGGRTHRLLTPLPIGRARIRRPGDDVTVVTYGGMVRVALEAAEALAADGIDCEVIDLRTLKPWDRGDRARFGRQDGSSGSGAGASEDSRAWRLRWAATVAEEALYDLEAPIVRVAGFDAPWPPVRCRAPRDHHFPAGSCPQSRKWSTPSLIVVGLRCGQRATGPPPAVQLAGNRDSRHASSAVAKTTWKGTQ